MTRGGAQRGLPKHKKLGVLGLTITLLSFDLLGPSPCLLYPVAIVLVVMIVVVSMVMVLVVVVDLGT